MIFPILFFAVLVAQRKIMIVEILKCGFCLFREFVGKINRGAIVVREGDPS